MKLNVKFEEQVCSFPVTLIDEEETFNVKFSELQMLNPDTLEEYAGPYTIYPNFFDQYLDTKDKKTIEDILVTQIRTFTTSNPQGGNTIYIGG